MRRPFTATLLAAVIRYCPFPQGPDRCLEPDGARLTRPKGPGYRSMCRRRTDMCSSCWAIVHAPLAGGGEADHFGTRRSTRAGYSRWQTIVFLTDRSGSETCVVRCDGSHTAPSPKGTGILRCDADRQYDVNDVDAYFRRRRRRIPVALGEGARVEPSASQINFWRRIGEEHDGLAIGE